MATGQEVAGGGQGGGPSAGLMNRRGATELDPFAGVPLNPEARVRPGQGAMPAVGAPAATSQRVAAIRAA